MESDIKLEGENLILEAKEIRVEGGDIVMKVGGGFVELPNIRRPGARPTRVPAVRTTVKVGEDIVKLQDRIESLAQELQAIKNRL